MIEKLMETVGFEPEIYSKFAHWLNNNRSSFELNEPENILKWLDYWNWDWIIENYPEKNIFDYWKINGDVGIRTRDLFKICPLIKQ